MNSETVNLVRELSERLGVGLDQLIDLFVTRVIADAVFTLLFCVILSCVCYITATRWWAMECDNSSDEPIKMFFVGIFVTIAVFLIGAFLNSAVTAIASPRAAAIIEILRAARGGS